MGVEGLDRGYLSPTAPHLPLSRSPVRGASAFRAHAEGN
jgi:hypothetical protein